MPDYLHPQLHMHDRVTLIKDKMIKSLVQNESKIWSQVQMDINYMVAGTALDPFRPTNQCTDVLL
jgi:hypothetical protein